MLAPGTVVVSRYRVLSQIGRGGMGEVFLVEHVHTGDRAALKVLHGAASTDSESIERFKREARAPARIQSENVVRVMDADMAPELGGVPFLVMELLQGSDLQKSIAKSGPLALAEVWRILGQVARALDKAHAMGIVHRDLKPENLFVHQREDGTSVVKILDFGISKGLGDDPMVTGAGQLTRTGAIMGTPLYMAAEQALGRRELIGPGTDIWALGLIAIWLLTGEPYWQGRTVPDILSKVLSHAMYPPSSRWPLPPALDAWLLRSCARLPEHRFRTAGEQVAELTAILQNASNAALAQAPTMLPTPAFAMMTPPYVAPQVTPPHVTPPQVRPPSLPPTYAMAIAGGSTNDPLVHTARPLSAPSRGGMGLGAKVAVIMFAITVVLAGVAVVLIALVIPRFTKPEEQPITFAPATTTPAATVTPTAESSIEPLVIGTTTAPKPRSTAAATTAAATAAIATATTATAATATAAHNTVSREPCRASCRTACFDATDVQDCLVKCLRKCSAP